MQLSLLYIKYLKAPASFFGWKLVGAFLSSFSFPVKSYIVQNVDVKRKEIYERKSFKPAIWFLFIY